MSVNVDLAQHGLSEAEQLAVFEFMNRGQQVNAYEVQQHIAVSVEEKNIFLIRVRAFRGDARRRARRGDAEE
jgi:hypothetical protein